MTENASGGARFDAFASLPVRSRAMSSRASRALVVVTSVGTEEEAIRISRELIGRRHAACVNIISSVKSIYRWRGKICSDSEYLLVIKSLQTEYDLVAGAIRELSSYELPEILSFAVKKGDPGFIEWIESSLDKTGPPPAEDEEEDEVFVDLDDTLY